MHGITVISLNIERDCHLPKVLKFLSEQDADVILLQEVFKRDLIKFEDHLLMSSNFTGICHLHCINGAPEMGIATFSKIPITSNSIKYYRGAAENLPYIDKNEPEKMARALMITEVDTGMEQYCFVNTHFTWSANGVPSELQFSDYRAMVQILDPISEYVLCGDFNAPRGTAIFDLLAAKYTDNIPNEIKTTLDRDLHKVGHRDLVVDGVFTTSKYRAHNVKVISGVSDHCALSFSVTK
jgi:endonuclease/exonuclease/phosphatase family metal-dependent hydrolase